MDKNTNSKKEGNGKKKDALEGMGIRKLTSEVANVNKNFNQKERSYKEKMELEKKKQEEEQEIYESLLSSLGSFNLKVKTDKEENLNALDKKYTIDKEEIVKKVIIFVEY